MLGTYLGAGSAITGLLLHFAGNVTDSSGNSNNGSASGITYPYINRGRQQVALFGSAGRIALTSAASLKPTGSFTISFCFKYDAAGSEPADRYIYQSSNQSKTALAGILVKINSSGNVTLQSARNTGVLGGNDYREALGTSSVDDGVLHRCVVNWDGSYLNIYVDGVRETHDEWSYSPAYQAVNYCTVGAWNVGGVYSNYLNGYLDELILEHVAWSPEKVKKDYSQFLGRFATI